MRQKVCLRVNLLPRLRPHPIIRNSNRWLSVQDRVMLSIVRHRISSSIITLEVIIQPRALLVMISIRHMVDKIRWIHNRVRWKYAEDHLMSTAQQLGSHRLSYKKCSSLSRWTESHIRRLDHMASDVKRIMFGLTWR